MKTKEQTYNVVLQTTDEEIDGENWIDEAIREYIKSHNKTHISDIIVDGVRNEWGEEEWKQETK